MIQQFAAQQTTYLPPPSAIYESCTPIMDGEWVHLRRTGFLGICKWEGRRIKRNADALRFFEIKTNQRIAFLRERYGIPEGYLPFEDYLWIDGDEATLREIPPMIGWTYEKSSLAHCLRDHAEEGQKPSLIEQKFLRSRYIARLSPGGELPETTIFYEERWNSKKQRYVVPFIFCDEYGDYEGFDGVVHNAMAEGHVVIRQFLYEIENVNQALYAWKFLDPPPPKERWMPVQVRQKGSALAPQESANSDASSASVTTENKSWQTSAGTAAQGIDAPATGDIGKTASDESADLFMEQHSMNKSALQRNSITIPTKVPERPDLYRHRIDAEALRAAPWCAETLMGLSSKNLKIPDPEACDEDVWKRDWDLSYWQDLIEMTRDLDPRLAWERIDIVEQYMETLGSPSWWQRPVDHPEGGRTTKVPVTARNVRERFKEQYKDYRRCGGWYPATLTPYDGPPLLPESDNVITDYAGGYGGVEVSAPTTLDEDVTPASPQAIEVTAGDGLADVPPDRNGEQLTDEAITVAAETSEPAPEPEVLRVAMSVKEAEDLAAHIMAEHPGISLDYRVYGDDDVAVRLEHTPGRWCTVRSVADWNSPPNNALKGMIRDAIAYGEARASAGPDAVNDDERGPPSGSGPGEEVREMQGDANDNKETDEREGCAETQELSQ